MPKQTEVEFKLLDGDVVLYKRSKSDVWQARLRIGGKWKRATTKARNFEDAKVAAKELFYDNRTKHKNNIPIITSRFGAVSVVRLIGTGAEVP